MVPICETNDSSQNTFFGELEIPGENCAKPMSGWVPAASPLLQPKMRELCCDILVESLCRCKVGLGPCEITHFSAR